MSTVQREVVHGTGRILLNRPEQMNAITVELGRELEAALRELGQDPRVNVILMRGAGGNLSAGGDFHEVERLREEGASALAPLFENFARACAVIARIEVPVVVAVEGVAMAGGFELMQAADVVLARSDARIADNHVRFGQIPGGGSTQRLPRLVGRQRALGHLLSGDRLSGDDAVARGLAYRSYPPEDFDDSVEAFVTAMASRRRDALVGIKRLVQEGLELPLEKGLGLELEAVLSHIAGEAGGDGVSTFNDKGK